MLRDLPKADVGRGSNTEKGIAKPVAPFLHSYQTAVNNLLQKFQRRASNKESFEVMSAN